MNKAYLAIIALALVVVGAVFIPLFILIQRATQTLSTVEIITILIYPIFASAAASLLVTYLFRLVDRPRWTGVETRLGALTNRRISCLGTKYEVPNGGEFWNSLLHVAQRRFFLIGNTNKSWIWKDEDQAKKLAQSIYDIVSRGGEVRIVSNDDVETIKKTKQFIDKHLRPLVAKKADKERFTRNFIYRAVENSNYSGVVSDDRLVLMPVMNTGAFRAESMVLDLNALDHEREFKNYLGDIGRITGADGEGTPIPLVWE